MSGNKEIIEKLYGAYLYGFPLLVLDLHFQALTNTVHPTSPTSTKALVNQFIHATNVTDAGDRLES